MDHQNEECLYGLLAHFSDPFKTSFKNFIKVDWMQILAVGAQSRSCLRLPSASCRKLNTLLKATVMLLWVSTTPVGGKLRLGFEWHRFHWVVGQCLNKLNQNVVRF